MAGPGPRRRTLLSAGLAAAVAPVVAAPLAACTAPGDTRSGARRNPSAQKEKAIFDLSFRVTSRYRPFELVSEAFTTLSDGFAGDHTDLTVSSESAPAPFCAVEVTIAPDNEGVVVAGLAAESGHHLLAFYDPVAGRVGIEVANGDEPRVLAEAAAPESDEVRLGFALCENQATVLVDAGDGWQALATERDAVRAVVDMRSPGTLARYRYAWGARPGSGTARLASGRAGLFGMAGIRDQHLVQNADGTPYVRDGRVYLTATCAGLGFFQQAHWGVFTMDLARPERLEQVAQLYFARDGLVLGDHAGQIVRDGDRWIVATSSWGDFDFNGVHVRHLETEADVLHGVHVLEAEATPLPTEVSAWDPGLTKIDGRWHVSFVESPSQEPFDFHPALAVAADGDDWTEGLELVGAATDLHQCEGPIVAQVGGRWWFLASDGDNREYPVFDLQMKRHGSLDAPYETNIPHPQLLPDEAGGFWLVTFDGTQHAEDVLGYGSHGDVLVMHSEEGA